MDSIEEIQDYIHQAFTDTGLNQNSLSVAAGLGKEGVRNILRGHMPSITKLNKLKRFIDDFKANPKKPTKVLSIEERLTRLEKIIEQRLPKYFLETNLKAKNKNEK